jgi:hypothetical protein
MNPNPDTPIGLPGDYNQNQVVDAADYVVWRDRIGGGATPPLPNDDTPGIGQDDYTRWQSNFGKIPGAASFVAVPEPGVAMISLALFAGSLGRIRRT